MYKKINIIIPINKKKKNNITQISYTPIHYFTGITLFPRKLSKNILELCFDIKMSKMVLLKRHKLKRKFLKFHYILCFIQITNNES